MHSDTRDRAGGFTRTALALMMSAMLERDAGVHLIQPVFPSAPDLVSPSGALAGWLLDPPGALVQFMAPVKGTMELASWLVGPAFEVLNQHFPGRSDLTLVLDLANMVGRSAAARSILLHSAKILGPRFARAIVIPPLDYPPMYLKAFHASVAFVRLLGMNVTVAGSSRAVIERYGIVAASGRNFTSPVQPEQY